MIGQLFLEQLAVYPARMQSRTARSSYQKQQDVHIRTHNMCVSK